MAGTKISELPAATLPLTGSELVPVVQSGATVQTTLATMPYVPTGTGAVTTTVQAKLRETVSFEDFGAIGDSTTNDTVAIGKAFDYAISTGAAISMGAKTYLVTAGVLQKTGTISINGAGAKSIFKTLGDNSTSIIKFTNNHGGRLENFKIQGGAVTRLGNGMGLWVNTCQNLLISGLEIEQVSAAGIFNAGCTDTTITACKVKNSKADGIFNTDGCKRISVIGNHIESSGDDGISVVSYLANAAQIEDVSISGNTVLNSLARGITNIGGKNVTISGNTINGTSSSGVLIAEDSSALSRIPQNTSVTANIITNAGQTLPQVGNQYGVELAAQISGPILGTVISNNVIKTPYQIGACLVSSCVFNANIVSDSGRSGVEIQGDDVTVSNNTVTNAAYYGIVSLTNSPKRPTVIGNRVINANYANAASYYDSYNLGGGTTDAIVIGNIAIDTQNYTERSFELAVTRGVFTGNMSFGKINVGLVGSTDVVVNPAAGTAVPTFTGYATGTTYMRSGTSEFYVLDSTTWKKTTVT